jgi:hypothetical protein
MKRFQRLYVTYLIKNPVPFYAFLGIFITVFLVMSLAIHVDVVKSFPAVIDGARVLVQSTEKIPISSDVIYIYTNRNEHTFKVRAENISYNGNMHVLQLVDSKSVYLSGDVTVDLITGSQTLLKRIFVKAGTK